MTSTNQQLLDYAVENITEWATGFTHLRADTSTNPLFFTVGEKWTIACGYWGHDTPTYESIKGTLGEVDPQVITKDEWLAEIKRREEPKMLERNKEYDVKLTGEEIAELYLITGSACGLNRVYATLSAMLGADGEAMNVELPSIKLRSAIGYEAAMIKLLPPSETEEQRHLRELQEQYVALGEKIKQLSK
jgi:hypothetical protein